MAVDKDYCMSSFLAFRYIYDSNKEFGEGIKHRTYNIHGDKKVYVESADEIDAYIRKQFEAIKGKKLGILLSGGMDSAILASYMSGCDAYTFRFMNGKFQSEELSKAELFAKTYGLKLHYIDIDWETVKKNIDTLITTKGAPIHSIEPQIYEGAIQAKKDGVELMIIGDAADYVFYGMDGLLSKDWLFEDFYKRCIYIEPSLVLKKPVDMHFVFEKYRKNEYIDFLGMYDSIITEESYASYDNAFFAAGMNYHDPYEAMKMKNHVDLNRIRSGDSKYLIRELFRKKYPNIEVPNKNPMPRPVDEYFRNWNGPTRKEFRDDIDMSLLSGNQKWLLWSLEYFLNFFDEKHY